MPYLNCLTINGSWLWAREYPITEGILPLGQGNFDVQHFLTVFDRLGYRGPVGIQGYGITGNIPRLLENSIDAWLLYCARL
jgi:sugar phosphate isomerase/epimerase